MRQQIKKFDWFLIGAVLILCAVGILELWSINAGDLPTGLAGNFFIKQLIFIVLGLATMLVFGLTDVRVYKNYSSLLIVLYFLTLFLLAVVLVLGHKIRGTAGWLKIGELGFAPVELAKIAVILILAKYFSRRHVEVFRIRHIIISALYAALPAVLVLLQPDLGSALVLISIWLGIVILSGMKQRHLLIVLIVGAVLASLAWFFVLKTYQQERILTFLNPAKDPLGYSYNLIQSKIAIGNGGLLGRGLGHGTQGQLNFLPEKHNDFIFSLFAEEWGLAGILFLFSVWILFFWRLFKIILASGNNFFRLFVAGYAIMIFTQVFINAGMCLGLLPITGISFPFLSYGGSNLLINFVGLGIVLNIYTQTKKGF